jgi:glutamyl-tRNA synthetase
MIKVRFAPSPTGYLHIGGARTALFNWLYAKAQKGIFVLRIEDTDQKRSRKEYETEILDSLNWLGLSWDEIFYQSQRFSLYREYAETLVKEDKAYKDGEAILLKMPKEQIRFYDIVRGEINFDTSHFVALDDAGRPQKDEQGEPRLKDEVLIKADGTPAYSFCCVVDDALMQISHVIRGEDHISNTPKQIVMYNALGFPIPKFAHLPLILGEDGARLSKRTGAVAVTQYRDKGFLSEALANYLTLLGWSPKNNQEIFDIQQIVKKFSIKKINKAAAVFSLEKLTWINAEHIKSKDLSTLTDRVIPFLQAKSYIEKEYDRAFLEKIVKLYQKRTPTLVDFLERTAFIFKEEIVLPAEMKEELEKKGYAKEFQALRKAFAEIERFDAPQIEQAFRGVVQELGMNASDLVHPVRMALTASSVGPGLFETIEVLGKEKTLQRLSGAYH